MSGHLRHEQLRGQKPGRRIVIAGGLATNPNPAITVSDFHHFDQIIAAGQGLRGDRNATSVHRAEMGTACAAVRIDHCDFFERRDGEYGALHCVEIRADARTHAGSDEAVQRRDCLADPRVGERDRALGGCGDLVGGLPLDGEREPVIEQQQGCAGEARAKHNGNNVLTRKNARELLHTLTPNPTR